MKFLKHGYLMFPGIQEVCKFIFAEYNKYVNVVIDSSYNETVYPQESSRESSLELTLS